ncbi:DUF695 domain-containing protein [Pseudomonas tolaasii]|uniref:DUF695 domain-containing protein n=1 Tax=Pseudomonas tolaasii TaxID=29442 RepID=UPI001C58EF3E|nr:DUF695 domain-containing protein [Pseudomonas tolaasii]MBW1248940.1 DUF695 domain-containing protein [Pseudomonas tolaasii]
MKDKQSNKRPLTLLVLASVLTTGCAGHPPAPAVERNPCLDEGPVHSVAFDRCVADRAADRAEALRRLLDDANPNPRQQALAEPGPDDYQDADFPDTPNPMLYQGARSVTAAERRALPYKIRITWKYSSKTLRPAPRDLSRMEQMRSLIVPAVQEQGLAKWLCTVTGGQQVQWIFYAESEESFRAQVNAALAKSGPYPLAFTTHKEPAPSGEMGEAETVRITPKTCME